MLNMHPAHGNEITLSCAALLIVVAMFSVRAKREHLLRRYGYLG